MSTKQIIGGVAGGVIGGILGGLAGGPMGFNFGVKLGATIGAGTGMGLGMGIGAGLDGYEMPSQIATINPTQDLTIPTNQEGIPVPVIYGTVKIAGNFLWYGNLSTTPVYRETEPARTGKGPGDGGGYGSTTQLVGYNYYADAWIGLCMGNISLGDVYVNDTVTSISTYCTLNRGDQNYYPTEPGTYATKLSGIAHLFLKGYPLGENRASFPNLQFTLTRILDTGINHENMTNGSNPAAVIYDLLTDKLWGEEIDPSEINLDNFNACADYFYAKGYGLNFTLNSQKSARDIIADIEGLVGCVFGNDEDGLYSLRILDPQESAVGSLGDDDFIDFALKRQTWDDTNNDFRGDYIDPTQAYTTRGVQARNSANVKITGSVRQEKIDLTVFTDKDVASDRINEYMKSASYPRATINATTNLTFSKLRIGDVVSISNSEYSITAQKFRVSGIDIGEIDSGKLKFSFIQMTESMFDQSYVPGGAPKWTRPDYSPSPLAHQKIHEQPYTTGAPNYFALGARSGNHETGMRLMISPDGNDYKAYCNITRFAQRGLLKAPLPSSEEHYDTTNKIIYEPSLDDIDFPNISNAELSRSGRLALIGSELIGFELYQPGTNQGEYEISNLWRGAVGSIIDSHSDEAEVWIFYADGLVFSPPYADFYVKLLPYTETAILDQDEAQEIHVTSANVDEVPYTWEAPHIVRNLSLLEDQYVNRDGDYIPTLIVTYDLPLMATYWDHAKIQIRKEDEAEYRDYRNDYSRGAGITIDGVTGLFSVGDTVYVRVISMSSNGIPSDSGQSPIQSIQVTGVVTVPAAPTGLELEGASIAAPLTWDGLGFAIQWRRGSLTGGFGQDEGFGEELQGFGGVNYDPLWLYDEVELWIDDNLIDVKATKECRYLYIYGDGYDAHIDHYLQAAHGVATIKVRRWTKFNKVSEYASITISQQPPPAPTGISVESFIKVVYLKYDKINIPDFGGFKVHMTKHSEEGPTESNLVYQGLGNTLAHKVSEGGTWYIHVGAYDIFDDTNVSYADAYSVNIPTDDFIDTDPPATPTNLELSSGIDIEDISQTITAKIVASWDSNTESDFARYILRLRIDDDTAYAEVATSETAYMFSGLVPGRTYYVKIAAEDKWANRSAFSSEESIVASQDESPPAVPQNLVIAAGLKKIVINFDGVSDADLAGYEVHVSDTNGFIPDSTTLKAKGLQTLFSFEGLAATTYYVRVRSYDWSNNKSEYTAQASATTAQVGTSDITLEAIDSTLLADLAVVHGKIAELAVDTGNIRDLAVTDAKICRMSASKIIAGIIEVSDNITIRTTKLDDCQNAVVIDSAGFHAYDGNCNETFRVIDGNIRAKSLQLVDAMQCPGAYTYLDSGEMFYCYCDNAIPHVKRIDGGSAYSGETICLHGWVCEPKIMVGIQCLKSYDEANYCNDQAWKVCYSQVHDWYVEEQWCGKCFNVYAMLTLYGAENDPRICNCPFNSFVYTCDMACYADICLKIKHWGHGAYCCPQKYCVGYVCYCIHYETCDGNCSCNLSYCYRQSDENCFCLMNEGLFQKTITFPCCACWKICAALICNGWAAESQWTKELKQCSCLFCSPTCYCDHSYTPGCTGWKCSSFDVPFSGFPTECICFFYNCITVTTSVAGRRNDALNHGQAFSSAESRSGAWMHFCSVSPDEAWHTICCCSTCFSRTGNDVCDYNACFCSCVYNQIPTGRWVDVRLYSWACECLCWYQGVSACCEISMCIYAIKDCTGTVCCLDTSGSVMWLAIAPK